MKNLLVFLILFPLLSFGQEVNTFKYIRLNSFDKSADIMTTATDVFSKKGFIVLASNSLLPADASEDPCSILTAKIIYKRGKKGWTNSKLKLSMINCENKVIYEKSASNTTNFNQPDVLNNFIKATDGIMPKTGFVDKTYKRVGTGEKSGNIPNIIIRQTINEMSDAGINLRTIKTIMKKFDGSLSNAINKWADSGNGKLSKKLVESAKKLGFNDVYLQTKLKLAKKERLKQGLIAGIAIATAVVAASAGAYGGEGGSTASTLDSYSPYYYNSNYDYSNSNKTYDTSFISNLDSSYLNSSYSSTYDSNIYSQEDNLVLNDYYTQQKIKKTNIQSLGPPPPINNSYNTPIIYGGTSSYVNGINSYNTGFDDSGTLNVYDSNGFTTGTMKKDNSGIGVYKDGIIQSYTSKPDNNGVSLTYSNGIQVSASKYDKDGNMSHFDDGGIATGYSKKVNGGYEHYDSGGMIQSFTSTDKDVYNPLDEIDYKP